MLVFLIRIVGSSVMIYGGLLIATASYPVGFAVGSAGAVIFKAAEFIGIIRG